MIKKESQNFFLGGRGDGERWGTGQRKITHTHTRNDRSKIVSLRSQFSPREWVEEENGDTIDPERAVHSNAWQVAKERKRRRESTNLTQSFLLCENLLFFFPSNLLASWQTIPKTFLLAANSQRNEVVEFKLSRGLYMYINSPISLFFPS